jgi:transposase
MQNLMNLLCDAGFPLSAGIRRAQISMARTKPLSSRAACSLVVPHRFAAAYVGVDGPSTASLCQNEVVEDLIQEEPSMNDLIRIGMDTSKSVFVLHGVDAAEQPVLRKTLRRRQVIAFFAKLPPTQVGMEACGGAHHWARELGALGHEVKLLPAQRVKPYVARNKNDTADAEGVCEAMSRPRMTFVPVKTAEQQAALMLAGMRDQLIARRTQLSNTIRGYAAEFGLVAAKGSTLPVLAQELFAALGEDSAALKPKLRKLEAQLLAWHRQNELSRRLAEIPGVGPIGAALMAMKVVNPRAFRSGRDFAAWLGLTPKDHSTAGKQRLGVITRAGDEALRRVLVLGATAVIQQVRHGRGYASPWLIALLRRKPPKLAAVALANKTARIAWKLMVSGERYRSARAAEAAHGDPCSEGASPHPRKACTVLAAVKARPISTAARRTGSATAGLDGGCARRASAIAVGTKKRSVVEPRNEGQGHG